MNEKVDKQGMPSFETPNQLPDQERTHLMRPDSSQILVEG
jgi:hypothetical protein